MYQSQGKYADAAGLLQRALAIKEKALGASHPDVAGTLNNLANVYQLQGKYADAEGHYQRALAIREKALGANHPDVANSLIGLANVFRPQRSGRQADGGIRRSGVRPAERAIALAARARQAKQAAASRPTATRAYSAFWQGADVDRAQLARGLPSVLDTADELKAVATKVGAPASDIHLDKDATETTVKRLALADYRVVYFATHGLVAGDVKGLASRPSRSRCRRNRPRLMTACW